MVVLLFTLQLVEERILVLDSKATLIMKFRKKISNFEIKNSRKDISKSS